MSRLAGPSKSRAGKTPGISGGNVRFTSDLPWMQPVGPTIVKNKRTPGISENTNTEEERLREQDYQQRVKDNELKNKAEWDKAYADKQAIALEQNLAEQKATKPTAQLTQAPSNEAGYQAFLKTHPNPIGVKETDAEKRALYEKSLNPQVNWGEAAGLAIGTTASLGGVFDAIGNWAGKMLNGVFGKSAAKTALSKTNSITTTGWMSPATRITTTQAIQGAQKTLFGINTKLLAGITIAGGLATADKVLSQDSLTNWAALDNVIGSMNIMTRDIKTNFPNLTPEQRIQAIKDTEQAQIITQAAEDKITASAMYNPYTMAYAKAWKLGIQSNKLSMQRNIDYIKNYDPTMDQWSIESQTAKTKKNLQTYGKPKYDEQGNPLY